MEAALGIILLIITVVGYIVIGQIFGYWTPFKALFVGIGAWLMFWLITFVALEMFVNILTFPQSFLVCSEKRYPFIGDYTVCDFKNIPLIVGIIMGIGCAIGAFVQGYQERKTRQNEQEQETSEGQVG